MTMDQLGRNDLLKVLNNIINMQRELSRRKEVLSNYQSQYESLQVVPKRSFVERVLIAFITLWIIQIPLAIPAVGAFICSELEKSNNSGLDIIIPIVLIVSFALSAVIIFLIILTVKGLNKKRKKKYLKSVEPAMDSVMKRVISSQTEYESYKQELEKTYNYYNIDNSYRNHFAISRIYSLLISNYNLSYYEAAKRYDEEERHQELMDAQNKIRGEVEKYRRETAEANRVREKQLNDVNQRLTEIRNVESSAYYNMR